MGSGRYGGWGPCGRMLYHRKVVVLTMRQYVLQATGTGNAIGGDRNISGPDGRSCAPHVLVWEARKCLLVRPCQQACQAQVLGRFDKNVL